MPSSPSRLWDVYTKWEPPQDNLLPVDYPVLGFEYGKGGTAGDRANNELAFDAEWFRKENEVYVQDGILVSLENLYDFSYEEANLPRLHLVGPRGDAHLTTRDVGLAFAKEVPPGQPIIVLARRQHLLRCKWTMEKLGYDVLSFPVDTPCDPASTQLWTKSDLLFMPYEFLLARHYFWLKGWI